MSFSSYVTENVMASVELARELIVRIAEVLEAVLPQAHVAEFAERLVVRFDPVRRTEGHHQNNGGNVREDGAEHQSV